MSDIMAPKVSISTFCALLGLACAEEVVPAATLVSTYEPEQTRPVDVLVVVDDSPSMHGHQPTLAANLEAFGQVLMAQELELDVRVAVVTTSVAGPTCSGAFARGGELLTDTCASLPESAFVGPGELEMEAIDHSALRESSCTLATIERRISPIDELETDLALRPWFEGPTNSYGGNLPDGVALFDALREVGLRGFGGCEFESPLAAARDALDRVRTAGDPAFGFLREGAPLLIVFLGDEDDCSHPQSSATIFDPAGERVFWSNPEGDDPTSAVCHNASTTCDAQGCTIVDRDLAGAETTDIEAAVLDPVAAFQAELEVLRTDREVALLLVGGVASGGSLQWPAGDPMDAGDLAWREQFGWSPGCTGANGASAQPPGRLHAVIAAGVDEPLVTSICDGDWTQLLDPISTGPALLMPWCAPPEVTAQRDCEVSVHTPTETIALPSCEFDENDDYVVPLGADRCSVSLDDPDAISPECADAGSSIEWQLVVRPGTLPLPRGSVFEAWCQP